MTFVLASNNMGKLREFHEILEPLDISVVPQDMVGALFEVNETGDSFAENAFLKASAVVSFSPFPVVADDSGLCVDALNGAPGLYSARFGEPGWTDKQKYEYLLQKLEGAADRTARFVCSICCILPGGRIVRAEGECRGRILEKARGEGGFGYDPVFAPDGYEESFAELGQDVKNKISHRAKALAAFREELEKLC